MYICNGECLILYFRHKTGKQITRREKRFVRSEIGSKLSNRRSKDVDRELHTDKNNIII